MFSGTSFLSGFWTGLGRVLGGQNRAFSYFFRNFFDATFRVQLERAKNANKSDHPLIIPSVWRYVRAWGEGFRMGGSLPKPEFQA